MNEWMNADTRQPTFCFGRRVCLSSVCLSVYPASDLENQAR